MTDHIVDGDKKLDRCVSLTYTKKGEDYIFCKDGVCFKLSIIQVVLLHEMTLDIIKQAFNK